MWLFESCSFSALALSVVGRGLAFICTLYIIYIYCLLFCCLPGYYKYIIYCCEITGKFHMVLQFVKPLRKTTLVQAYRNISWAIYYQRISFFVPLNYFYLDNIWFYLVPANGKKNRLLYFICFYLFLLVKAFCELPGQNFKYFFLCFVMCFYLFLFAE